MNKQKTSLLVVAVMILVMVIFIPFLRQKQEQRSTPTILHSQKETEESALKNMKGNFQLKETFSSHLPLIIIDTNSQAIGPYTYWDEKKERFIAIEGMNPNVYGTMKLIDNMGNENALMDPAKYTSRIRIRRRGNSSMVYEKGQYNMKLLLDNEDKSNPLSLLDMGEESHWILNGSMVDKSLMRNYIAYELTKKFMPFVPDSRYCEIIFQEGNQYVYQGVYLLVESIRQGSDRVNINEYNPKNVYADFIIRRDRDGKSDVMLDTYGTRNGLTYKPGHEYDYGHLGLIYPSAEYLTPETQQYIEEKISKMEETLYSEQTEVASNIDRYIDIDSFVDLFLANEFFSNYDAGYHSTYFYSKKGGKIYAGPVWDYDGAMDNYRLEPMDYEEMWFYQAPWFDQLVEYYPFDQKLKKRYASLRQGPLHDTVVEELVDNTASYLASAQIRDWKRWEHIYLKKQRYTLEDFVDQDGDIIQRESNSYDEEIRKLKRTLREHGYNMDQNIGNFDEFSRDDSNHFRPWQILCAIFSIIAFFVSIIIVRRES